MTDLGRAAARGTRVTLTAQLGRFALQLVSLVVLSRLLSPQDFGLVAMVTSILGVAEILRDAGLSSAAVQAQDLNDGERSNLFWLNVLLGSICTLGAIALTPVIVHIYGQPSLAPIVLALAWLFLVSGVNTQFRADLSRGLRFHALALSDVVAQAASVVAAITAALLGAGPWAIVVQLSTLSITGCALNVVQSRWRPGLPRRGVPMGRFFKFGGPLLGMQLLGYATNNVDNVALGAVWGSQELGLYSRGYQMLIVPLNQVSNALTGVTLPVLSRVQDDRPAFDRYLHRARVATTYLFGTTFAVAAGLAVPLVAVVLGRQWSGVAPIFAILAIGGMFRGFAQVTYWITLSRGLTGTQFKAYLLLRPLMIAAILCGLPWGATGVAMGHTVSFVIEWALMLWWLGRHSDVNVRRLFTGPLRSILVVSAPAGLAAYIGAHLTQGPVVQLVAGASLAALVVAVIGLLSPRERADVKLTLEMMRKAF